MSDALRDALTRLWPAIERGMGGLVFTAERAGEVAADMQTVRAALSAPAPAPAEPDPLIAKALEKARAIGCTDPQACTYHGRCAGRCVQPLLNANTALRLRATAAPAAAPAPAEPVAALLRSRSVTTWSHCAVDGKTHYGNWGAWIPTTYQHAKAVTDPSRNTDPVCYEMRPLYAAPAAPAGWQWVPVEPTPEMVEAITECINLVDYRKGARAGWQSALAAAPGAQGDAA